MYKEVLECLLFAFDYYLFDRYLSIAVERDETIDRECLLRMEEELKGAGQY